MTRLQNRLAKVAAQLGNTAGKMYVTAAPADMDTADVLRELGIVLDDRDQHVHIRKFFAGEGANGHDERAGGRPGVPTFDSQSDPGYVALSPASRSAAASTARSGISPPLLTTLKPAVSPPEAELVRLLPAGSLSNTYDDWLGAGLASAGGHGRT